MFAAQCSESKSSLTAKEVEELSKRFNVPLSSRTIYSMFEELEISHPHAVLRGGRMTPRFKRGKKIVILAKYVEELIFHR
jgi:transposase